MSIDFKSIIVKVGRSTELADLQAVRDALALEHPLLVGHSFGGLLVVEHAAAHPGCVGVDGGLRIERPPVGWEEVQAQLDRPVTRLLSRVATSVGMGAAVVRGAAASGGRGGRARGPPGGGVRAAGLPDAGGAGRRGRPGAPRRADASRGGHRRHPPPAAASEVKLARLACGHAIPLERPRELADLIVGFAE